ncbi:hypothetical protein OJAV_G00140930 [Oryzias javanicus]|uniref:Uncharacterized protein n=1 Tax=Oryzias javanicus TaxID=123683 RepID=A0A437CNA8_ORYJA|nr:hypothetical protein OJAV_G00140930 [Oryzias javanicus]
MDDIFTQCREGNSVAVRLWLDNTENDLNLGDDHGFSPLHWACREGRSGVVDMLIMRGARINVMNRGDDTPLHLAASHGHRDIVAKLIQCKADPNTVNEHGNTPLHYACFWGQEEVAEDLVVSGAQVCICNRYGQTPLDKAKPHLRQLLQEKAEKMGQSMSKIPYKETFWKGTMRTRPRNGTLNKQAGIDYKQLSLLAKINENQSGELWQGRWQGDEIIVKVLHVRDWTTRKSRDFNEEHPKLRIFSHPNILPVLGACQSPPSPHPVIITHYMPYGSLFNILHQGTTLVVDQSQAVKFALDIASGMAFLHTLEPMVSRLYLNSKHVMIDEDMTARVSMADAKFSFQCPGRMYSPAWMAPEALQKRPEDINRRSADMWSFAVLLWELVTREVPFADLSHMEIGMKVALEGLRPTIPPGISPHILKGKVEQEERKKTRLSLWTTTALYLCSETRGGHLLAAVKTMGSPLRWCPLPPLLLVFGSLLVTTPLLGSCHPSHMSPRPGPVILERFPPHVLGFNWRNLTCPLCKTLFTIVDIALLSDTNAERVARAVGEACIRLHLAEEQVCREITDLFRDDFIRALQESLLWPSEACAVLVRLTTSVIATRLPLTASSPIRAGFLFLTDVHWDKEYQTGSAADCKDPLCCRNSSGSPSWRRRGAGYWGTYSNCDLPLRTVESLLQNAARVGPWDWVYWTGDIPAHNVWSQTRDQQLMELTVISRLVHKHLGPNVTVYPAVEEWAPWLPDPAWKTLRYGGFYTVEIQPGLRVVSLNMNFCARENFWLMVNSTDPANQLQWLVHILQASEDKGEKVHIIGHIPPGLCLGSWSWNYYHIINRYERDHDSASRRGIRCTQCHTYVNLNPGYRVYIVDGNYSGSSRLVLDHETYILNLTEANRPAVLRDPVEEPKWTLLYRATEAYSLSTTFPSDYHLLLQTFIKDDRVFQKFWYLRHKGHVSEVCKETCKTTVLCFLQNGRSDQLEQCDLIHGFEGSMGRP